MWYFLENKKYLRVVCMYIMPHSHFVSIILMSSLSLANLYNYNFKNSF